MELNLIKMWTDSRSAVLDLELSSETERVFCKLSDRVPVLDQSRVRVTYWRENKSSWPPYKRTKYLKHDTEPAMLEQSQHSDITRSVRGDWWWGSRRGEYRTQVQSSGHCTAHSKQHRHHWTSVGVYKVVGFCPSINTKNNFNLHNRHPESLLWRKLFYI